ncbi:MAG TPA: hypothetical protein VLC92_07765 [Rhodocyclaceae bacterium]|nr:hypothetical protein [Rhodocyclaceae bacterium]
MGARTTKLDGVADLHLNGALVMLGGGEISQLAVAIQEPQGGGHNTDANARIASFKALQCGDRNTHALRPGFQRLFTTQTGYRKVSAKLFDSS